MKFYKIIPVSTVEEVFKSKFIKGFLIFNILDMIRNIFSCIISEFLIVKEKCKKIGKKFVG